MKGYTDLSQSKKVDLEDEIKRFTTSKELYEADSVIKAVAEHFYELGLKAQTDTFNDKAAEWLRNNSHNYADNALGKEYLVNDFKNYMKRE